MRYYVFIDNFRGFSNTRIPITDVNFLVGQNSTGKTSVLGLIKLLSGPRFLLSQQQFAVDPVNFGHFSDMVSAHSDDRSYFRIGMIWEYSDEKNQPTATGCLMTFVEQNGLPCLSKYTFCRGTAEKAEDMTLSFRSNTAYFKNEQHPAASTADAMVASLLPLWIHEHSTESNGYAKVELPGPFPGRIPILLALSQAWAGFRGSKGKSQKVEVSVDPDDLSFAPHVTWIAPIRSKPGRTYDALESSEYSPEGAHTPYLIKRMFRTKSQATKFKHFIEKIGAASGLFQGIQIKNFGRGLAAPFELDIVIDGKALNVWTVGYGVSQALPVLVELFARGPGSWLAIQQPEVHLHPRAQAALGDVFFEMAALEHKCFLVETHSDFAIDRFRMNYKSDRKDKPNSQILFFERRDKHNVVTSLPVGISGDLPANQPDSYREFFIREELRLLQL